VLVTGGGGYMGSVFVPVLLSMGIPVTVLDNVKKLDQSHFSKRDQGLLTIINGDLRDSGAVKKSLESAKSVVHLAAVSDGRAGREDPGLTREINYTAFKDFVKQAKESGCKRFIFASTFGVYGNDYQEPLTEELPVNPQEPYSESKAQAEEILRMENTAEFVTCSLRFAMVCGFSPRMRFDFILNALTYQALRDQKITIMGGEQRRPQIHIMDAANYLSHCLEVKADKINGQIFNAGGFNPSIKEMADTINRALGRNIKIEQLAARENENSFVLDSQKIKKQLGLKPWNSMTDAIRGIQEKFIDGYWDN
jgi:nucleoside-diphosphate-sugar epimerase